MYDYTTLKLASERGEILGTFNGISVCAIAKKDLWSSVAGRYYIVYDDDNKLVKNQWCYGTVTSTGAINEYTKGRYYAYPEPQVEKKMEEPVKVEEVNVAAKTIPLVDAGAEDFFIRIEKEIDELLKNDFNFEVGEV